MKGITTLIKEINKSVLNQMPFVVYSKPFSKNITAFFPHERQVQYLKDYTESGFVFAPFKDNEDPILFSHKNASVYSFDYDPKPLKTEDKVERQSQGINDDTDQQRHIELVRQGVAFIKQKNASKVVVSRKELVSLKEFDHAKVFKKMLLKYPAAFVYLWYHPEIGLWAGASPETLLRTSGKQFHTMALAGTQRYNGTENVIWHKKEVAEQQMVTDQITIGLKDEKIKVGKVYTKKAGNLLHLCTDITGEMGSDRDLRSLVQKLHPTAAVCGLPKKTARQFILEKERYERSYYSGFLGEINHKDSLTHDNFKQDEEESESNLFVNLRCMQIVQIPVLKAFLYIGGGITEGSIPELEWEETVEKSKVMKYVLFD